MGFWDNAWNSTKDAAKVATGYSTLEAAKKAQEGDYGGAAGAVVNPMNASTGNPLGDITAPDAPPPTSPTYGYDANAGNAATSGVRDLRNRFLSERDAAGPGPGYPGAKGFATDTTRSDVFRQRQLENLAALEAQARGEGPSVAAVQQRAGQMDINQNALGLAAGGDAGSRRMAARTLSDNGRRNVLDASLLRNKEMMDARQLVGQQAGEGRLADIGIDTGNANRFTDASKANQEASLRNRQLTIEERQGLGNLGLNAQNTETQTAQAAAQIQNLKDQLKFAYDQLAQARDEAEKERWAKIITSTIGAIATVGAAGASSSGSAMALA